MIFFNAVAIVVTERTNFKKIIRISLIWIFNTDFLDVDVLTGTAPSNPTIHFHPQTFTIKKNNVLCVKGSD